ncbi:MAG: metalloregulator ArsR/SmtB family transcription factor [Alphaproteobacteria bacterium]|nr:metalloregulator ArsR/SmtB family transcription factor [Alphaproteobacteria bacterium]
MSESRETIQPVFRALADPTRRAIIRMLAHGPRPIGEIASAFAMTRPAIAKHLAILRDGDLIIVEPKGRERINHFNPAALKAATDWLSYFDRFWDEKLEELKRLAEHKKGSS